MSTQPKWCVCMKALFHKNYFVGEAQALDLANGSGNKCKEIDILYCLVDLETETWHMGYSHEDVSLNIFWIMDPRLWDMGALKQGPGPPRALTSYLWQKLIKHNK